MQLGSCFSQGTSFQDVPSGNGLQMTREGSNAPLQNFQNLLPENMIPTANEQASQESEPMGNLQFATSNINTVIRDNLSPGMVPFISEINNNIPSGLDNIVSNQLPSNFPVMENIPNNLGNTFLPMEIQRPEQQLPRLLPRLQPIPQSQFYDFTPRIENEMEKQFQNIPQTPIFFNSPFSSFSQGDEKLGKSTFKQRFTDPMPYFAVQKGIENSPSTYIEDDIFSTKQRVPYESLSKKKYSTNPPPTSYTTTTATTSTTEEKTTTQMSTTTEIPTTTVKATTTTEKKTTPKSYPYHYRNVEQSKSKNVYPAPRLRFPKTRYPSNNRKNTKKNDLFSIPRYRGRNLYPKNPFFEPNPRFLRKPKFGGRNHGHKNCKNKRERRIQGRSSSESYGD